ncbi:MAG: hypothetical protein SF097_04590 [Acidobacteriota bacterium]|nr:hypothetical protein [Acidobacteriota bacterium]
MDSSILEAISQCGYFRLGKDGHLVEYLAIFPPDLYGKMKEKLAPLLKWELREADAMAGYSPEKVDEVTSRFLEDSGEENLEKEFRHLVKVHLEQAAENAFWEFVGPILEKLKIKREWLVARNQFSEVGLATNTPYVSLELANEKLVTYTEKSNDFDIGEDGSRDLKQRVKQALRDIPSVERMMEKKLEQGMIQTTSVNSRKVGRARKSNSIKRQNTPQYNDQKNKEKLLNAIRELFKEGKSEPLYHYEMAQKLKVSERTIGRWLRSLDKSLHESLDDLIAQAR